MVALGSESASGGLMSLSASCATVVVLGLFLSLLDRHSTPHLLSANKSGTVVAALVANRVKHHPTPIWSIITCSTARPEAEREHRKRFDDALTVEGQ